LGKRTPQAEAFLDSVVDYDNSDWRLHTPTPYFTNLPAKDTAGAMIAKFGYYFSFQSDLSIPITSKFRGCWESMTENLMMTAFHDLLHQVYSVYFSSKDLAKELERLGVGQANFATDPTSTDLWRAERALRAGKLRSLVNDPFRSHKLWKTVQATAQVYLTYFCDLMKQGDFTSIQDVVQAKWSMLTMTREDDSNPWLCAIGTLWSLLQPAEWVECSPFLAIGCLYYVAAGLLVKVLCVPQAYHLHDLGKKHNFASHLGLSE
jgi:hypothetical protein